MKGTGSPVGIYDAKFQMPESIEVDYPTYNATYGRFEVQPFERGYGITIGNALRRVLLASLPGSAITSVRIDGVLHEFTTITGVKQDVTEIILALKGVKVKLKSSQSEKIRMQFKGPLVLTAGMLQKGTTEFEILNPDHIIANLNEDANIGVELVISSGRGYVTAEDNREEDMPIGTIPIDSIFTPVEKVKFSVENTRVGQRTDYEKLILEVWTNGSITPDEAIIQSSKILRDHIQLFINFEVIVTQEELEEETEEDILRIRRLLRRPVDDLDLSVRSANCLKEAKIRTIADLVSRSEQEMLKYKNFGRKSLNELGEILEEHGLHFGFDIDRYLNSDAPVETTEEI